MTRQRFLAKQQCVEKVIVVDALDVTRNRTVSLDCACSAEIVYSVEPLLLPLQNYNLRPHSTLTTVIKSYNYM